ARRAGFEHAIAFDMGGTSTDVCLLPGGRAVRVPEREVGGLPVRLPTVDVHTVGAGGGSLVRRDAGGAVRVGPESAGADPGGGCSLGAGPRGRRRAARPRGLARPAARGGARPAAGGRGGSSLPGPVLRVDGRARGRARRPLSSRARRAVRLCRPWT